MSSVNKVIIVGNLGADPEVRQLQNGTMTTFSVATSERWRDKNTGDPREETEWHRITAFGTKADICSQYLRKGSKVYVEGSLKTNKYTDNQGIERWTTNIVLQNVQFLSFSQDNQQGYASNGNTYYQRQAPNQNQGYQQGYQQQPMQQQQQQYQQPQGQVAAIPNQQGYQHQHQQQPIQQPMQQQAQQASLYPQDVVTDKDIPF